MTRLEFIKEMFRKHGTDKLGHGYSMIYEKVPETAENVLEIGVGGGSSLRAWLEIFPLAHIYAIDRNAPLDIPDSRLQQFQSKIEEFDPAQLNGITFDLIVDDGSHDAVGIVAGFSKLHPSCRGLYVVEDVNSGTLPQVYDAMRAQSKVTSVIQTEGTDGDRVVVAQFGRVIEW